MVVDYLCRGVPESSYANKTSDRRDENAEKLPRILTQRGESEGWPVVSVV